MLRKDDTQSDKKARSKSGRAADKPVKQVLRVMQSLAHAGRCWRAVHDGLWQEAAGGPSAVAAGGANRVRRTHQGRAKTETRANIWIGVVSVLALLICGGSAAQAADCAVTIGPSGTIVTTQQGCTTTGSDKATVTVSGVTIEEQSTGAATNGIVAMTAGADATLTVSDVTIVDLRSTGPSLGINVTVDSPTGGPATTGAGTLNMSGTNSITIGEFSGMTRGTAIGSGGGTLINVRGTGDATTTISGTLTVLINSGMGAGGDSIARDDGVETTVHNGTATLDMRGLTGDSIVSVNGGNGLLIDSLRSGTNTNGGDVVVLGVSNALTVTVDNSQFGANTHATVNGGNNVANAGIMAATFGTGTVNIEGTAATIVTTGPLADGIHAISQLGTVSLVNSGTITTDGISSHGIEANTTNAGYGTELYSFGGNIPARSATAATGAVSVTNSGAITTSGGTTATDASHGIYAWTKSLGTGASGDVSVVNNAGGDITTSGDFSNAIRAQTESATGAAGAITVTNEATLATSGTNADGIAAEASGVTTGAVSVTNSGAVTTAGDDSNAIRAATTGTGTTGAAGEVNVTNTAQLQTAGLNANGIVAGATGATTGAVTVTNSGAITTSGGGIDSASDGIFASTASSGANAPGDVTVVNKAGGDITTAGDNSNAIRAESSSAGGAAGTITVTNEATVATSGASADAIVANSEGTTGDVAITNRGSVTATGVEANGISATTTLGTVTIDNSGSVSSSQASAILAVADDAANLAITNEGSIFGGTAGIRVEGFATTEIDNSGTIGAANDLAIDPPTGATTINNSGTITGYVTLGDGVNTMNNSGLWNLRNFDTPTGVLGVAVADFGNSGSNTVTNSGTLALLGAPTAGATVDGTGQYLPLAAGSVTNATMGNGANAMAVGGPVQGQLVGVQTFINSGVIDLTANKAAGDVLVITGGHTPGQDGGGVFVANGGSLRINTVLNEGGPNSQSDMLVVDSTRLGTAPVGIVVQNAGGLGAQTVGNGIAVVEVLNKSASANGVFALSGRAAAGAYEYALFHNGLDNDAADGNWYLRSDGLRQEVPVDTVVPALASRLGLAMLGSVSARDGFLDGYLYDGSFGPGEFCADPTDPRKTGLYVKVKAKRPRDECHTLLWGRVFGEVGWAGSGSDGQGGFGKAGPAYNFQYGGVEAGADLYRSARDRAGIYAGVVTGQADVLGVTNAWAGRVGMDSYGFGGYWTHRDPGGWYTDLVLQGNWYENIHASSAGGQSLDTQGWGITVSGETGYAIALGNAWSVIPQAQVVYQRTALDGAADQFGRVDYPATDEVYGRLGTRLAKGWVGNDGRLITTWLDTNFWHQFGDDARTTFTNLQGLNPTTLSASLGGTWAQVGLGLSGQVTRNVSIFGAADYNIALTQPGHSLGGRAGIRFTW